MLNRFTGSAERKAGLVAGVPLQRAGEPDEIANAIVFLASEQVVLHDRPGALGRWREVGGTARALLQRIVGME